MIIHMWKILHGKCPNDVQVSFKPISRRGIQAEVPPLPTKRSQRNQSLYENSFAVMGPRLWNSIPEALQQINDQQQFKIQLTQHLNEIPDEPAIPGYSCRNSNSILDWGKCADDMLQRRSSDPMSL